MEFLISKNVDMIVIACGTVSSNLSDYLKEKYNVKIVDIISPVINYLNNHEYEKIGVIATNATINSKVFSKSLNKDIKEVACPMFVPIIESNNLTELQKYLDAYLNVLKDRDIIVLGCTHYPIIKDEINKYLNNNIKLLDMSECISDITNEGKTSIELYFSELEDKLIDNVKIILQNNVDSINLV